MKSSFDVIRMNIIVNKDLKKKRLVMKLLVKVWKKVGTVWQHF